MRDRGDVDPRRQDRTIGAGPGGLVERIVRDLRDCRHGARVEIDEPIFLCTGNIQNNKFGYARIALLLNYLNPALRRPSR